MPIYEYRCRKCGHQFETMQKVADRPLRRCPECSGGLEKLISRTSFQLKGSGWYAQGYESSTSKPKTKPKKTGDDSKSKDKKKSGESAESRGSSGGSKSDPSRGAAA